MKFSKLQKAIISKYNSLRVSGSYSQNIAFTVSSKIGSFLLTLLITPLLSRIYAPDAYGIMSIFSVLLNLYLAIGTLGYGDALPIAKKKSEFYPLLIISVSFSFLCSLPFLLSIPIFAVAFRIDADAINSEMMILIWIGIIVASLSQSFGRWVLFRNDFKFGSINALVAQIINKTSSLFIGIIGWAPKSGLIIGEVLSNSFAFASYFKRYAMNSWSDLSQISKKRLIHTLFKFKSYPRYFPINNVLKRLTFQIPIFAIIGLYDLGTLGMYAMARSLINIPVTLFGSSMYGPFIQKMNSTSIADQPKYIFRTVKLLTGLMTGPSILIILLSGWVLPRFLGPNWSLTSEVAPVLCLIILHETVEIVLNGLFQKGGKEKMLFRFTILQITLSSIGLAVGYITQGLTNMILGFSLGLIAFYLLKFYYILKHFNASGFRHIIVATLIIIVVFWLN